jgi:hypothetical protein
VFGDACFKEFSIYEIENIFRVSIQLYKNTRGSLGKQEINMQCSGF